MIMITTATICTRYFYINRSYIKISAAISGAYNTYRWLRITSINKLYIQSYCSSIRKKPTHRITLIGHR